MGISIIAADKTFTYFVKDRILRDVAVTGGLGHALFSFRTPDLSNLLSVRKWRTAVGSLFNSSADFVEDLAADPDTSYVDLVDGDDSVVNGVTNGTFATDTSWTKGSGWSIGSGKASWADPTSGVLSGLPATRRRGCRPDRLGIGLL